MSDKSQKIKQKIDKRKQKIKMLEENLKHEKQLLKKDEKLLTEILYDGLLKTLIKNDIPADVIMGRVEEVIEEKEISQLIEEESAEGN